MKRFCFAVGLLAMQCGAAEAETWQAASTTAMSITGDVGFTPGHLRFARQDFAIRFVRTVSGLNADGAVQLYRVRAPRDPIVRNGNRVCGGAAPVPVTYFSVARSKDGISLAAYSGADEPGVKQNALCGIFNYTPQ